MVGDIVIQGFLRPTRACFWRRRAATVLIALVACTAVFSPAAALAGKTYVLKHPKREHCEPHYVKTVERVSRRESQRGGKVTETLCVYVKPPVPIPPRDRIATVTTVYTVAEYNGGSYVWVRGTVRAGSKELHVPITFTISRADGPAGSFIWRSGVHEACSIELETSESAETAWGASPQGESEEGCPLRPITVGEFGITGSFAGNSTYGPSVSKEPVEEEVGPSPCTPVSSVCV